MNTKNDLWGMACHNHLRFRADQVLHCMPERGRHLRGDALLWDVEGTIGLFKPSLDSDGLLFETGTEELGNEEDREELRNRRLLEIPATKCDEEEDEIGKLATITPAISGILVTLTHGWYSDELCPFEFKLPVLDRRDARFSWITEGSLAEFSTTVPPSPSLKTPTLSDVLSNLS